MCGIGGYVGARGGLDEDQILFRLRHRGPDHEDSVRLLARDGTPVWFGFRRLAILDLSPAGNQPMSTEDGAVTLVYNGEVYNFRALRDELTSLGHRFRSSGDTEVVLRGYRQWGPAVAERLRGMFAFAVWDDPEQRLVLCRDRLGIKPLYYHYEEHPERARLSFASELRALLGSGAVPGRLDPRGLHGYLALGSVPQPGTIVRDVHLLLPGHALVVPVRGGRPQAPTQHRYFSFPAPDGAQRPEGEPARSEVTRELAAVLQEAVALRLVSDVPVGVLLSGGVDSAAVAVLAARAQQALHSFTLTYGAGDLASEGPEAQKLARALGTRHHEHIETDDGLLARVPAYLRAVDQPSADGCNTYLVAQLVRAAGLKVALSGLGGDEVFLGYDLRRRFSALLGVGRLLQRGPAGAVRGAADRLSDALSLLQRAPGLDLPPQIHKGLALLLGSAGDPAAQGAALYAALRGLFVGSQIDQLLLPDVRAGLGDLRPESHVRDTRPPDERASLTPAALLTYLELDNYLSNTLLRDADVMSMVHGVELRVPLCDHVLVSRVLSIAADLREVPGRKKPLLVDASHSGLVVQAAARHKRGFVLPLYDWLRRGLQQQVSALLLDPALCQQAGLSPAQVAALWRSLLDGREHATWRVWALFTLLSWVKENRVCL